MNLPATQRTDDQKLSTWLADPSIQERLASSLIGTNIDGQAFTAQMIIAMEKPELKACSAASKLKAVHDCATLGLLPTLQQVALIPYKGDLKAMPQWQGYKAIMERNPEILEVEAHLVHVTDTYGFVDGEFHHEFDPLDDKRQFNSIKDCKGGYVRIQYRTRRVPKLHFVPAAEIEKAQKCAQTQDVWKKWFYQMALKTLYRNAYARRAVPVDPLAHAALQRLVEHDDATLGNDPSRVSYGTPMRGMSRDLRSSQPPAITYDEPLEPAADPEPTKDTAPDTSARDVWKQAIDKAVKTTSKAHLASRLSEIWDECQHPDNPISAEDRAWVASYLESKGLVFEKAGGKELFEKGAPQA